MNAAAAASSRRSSRLLLLELLPPSLLLLQVVVVVASERGLRSSFRVSIAYFFAILLTKQTNMLLCGAPSSPGGKRSSKKPSG
jgi:hypothetical protein